VGRKRGFRRGFGGGDEIGAADDGGTEERGELVISGGVGRNDVGVWRAVRNETGELIVKNCVRGRGLSHRESASAQSPGNPASSYLGKALTSKKGIYRAPINKPIFNLVIKNY